MSLKSDLRTSFRARLKEAWNSEAATQAHDALNERIVNFLTNHRQGKGLWAAYQPLGFEPDVRPALARLPEIEWVFPRVEGDHIEFYRPQDPNCFIVSGWGICEPDPAKSTPVAPHELAGLLIPGLAFDEKCNRLGRGRGYYDRFLSRLLPRFEAKGTSDLQNESEPPSHNQLKIGIAYDRQIAPQPLPVEPFDVTMDHVLTETRTLARRSSEPSLGRKTS